MQQSWKPVQRRVGRVWKFGEPNGSVLALFIVLSIVAWISTQASAQVLAPAVHLQQVVSGLNAPLDWQTARDGTGRLVIVGQGGRIRIVQGNTLLPTPVLNISSIIESGGV